MEQDHIIFDGRKMAAFGIVNDLCKDYGHDNSFAEELWEGLLQTPLLYDEFIYYMQKKELTGNYSYEGFCMFDLYFYQLRRYNLHHDLGKNMSDCDKDMLIYEAFHTMVMLKKNPQDMKKKLSASLGMDT